MVQSARDRILVVESGPVISANLNLPGLSGKDLMLALTSQGIQTHFTSPTPK